MTTPIRSISPVAVVPATNFATDSITATGPASGVKGSAARETLIGKASRSYTGVSKSQGQAMSLQPVSSSPTAPVAMPKSSMTKAVAPSPSFQYDDEVTLSMDAIGTDQAPSADALRSARLDRIKAEIDAGTYLTTDKLDAAIDNMLASF